MPGLKTECTFVHSSSKNVRLGHPSIVVKAIAPGTSNLSIVQVNAKDSQQKAIPLVTSESTVQVQP